MTLCLPRNPRYLHRLRYIQVLVAALLTAPLTELHAHEYYADGFMIIHPWAEPSPPDVVDAPVYFRLDDITKGDKLIKAYSPMAESVEFRAGDSPDAPVLSELSFSVGDTEAFGVGRPHLMLRGLRVPFVYGRFYFLMLEFEKAGKIVVGISVGGH